MMSWIFGILILGGVIAFIYVRTRSSPTPAQPLASTALPAAPGRIQPTPENIWGKRLVVNDPGACFAARALAGQYFPLDHVPGLPLKECNHADCRCTFQPAYERRSGKERREGIERRDMARFDAPTDRRSGKTRRKDDHYTWHTTI